MRHLLPVFLCLASTAFSGSTRLTPGQEKRPPHPGVDDVKVGQAIDKGIAFLRTAKSPDTHSAVRNSDELILWTFIHSGISQDDPKFKALLQSVLGQPLDRTYKVALLAMCLEEIDRVKYQEKIAHCAQFLVDNQCQNGQWSYGSPTEHVNTLKIPIPPKPVASGGKEGSTPAKDGKPKVLQQVPIKKMKEGPESGDNSNTQYAALGLRACFDAGIGIQEGVIVLAVKWLRESQHPSPKKDKEGKPIQPSGVSGKIEGWNYKAQGTDERAPYHAMTAGGTGSLILYDYMLERDWKKDSYVKAGMNWLTGFWGVHHWNTYYLYALERAGILYGTDTFGTHDWYKEGAEALLRSQAADGSWGKDTDWFNTTWDTCFSILFLRKATRPLVVTEAAGKLKK